MKINELIYNMKNNIQLILCRPSKEEIGVLKNITNRNFHFFLNSIDELSFDIPLYVYDENSHKKVRNEFYDLCIGDYLICAYNSLTGLKHYFVIENVQKSINFSDRSVKTIKCFSNEYYMSKINFPLKSGTYQLYKGVDECEEGEGILNILEKITNYKIGYISQKARKDTFEYISKGKKKVINERQTKVIKTLLSLNYVKNEIVEANKFDSSDLENKDEFNIDIEGLNKETLTKYRTFDLNNQKVINVIRDEIEKAFNVMCFFDTDKELINVYSKDEIGENKGLYISKEKFLKNINETNDFSKVVTKLHIYGKDGLTIRNLNPLGTDYLLDYSYYRNTKYMNKELLKAFDDYDLKLEENQIKFNGYIDEQKDLVIQKTKLEAEMVHLKNDVNIAEDLLSSEIAKGNEDIKGLNSKIQEAKEKVELQQTKIDNINIKLSELLERIKILTNDNSLENNFTDKQIKIIRQLTKEDTWTNENYFNERDLYENGLKAMNEVNSPPVDITLSIEDILQDSRNADIIEKLNLGDVINLYVEELDMKNLQLNLIEINYKDMIDKTELSFVVSNLKEKKDVLRNIGNTVSKLNKVINEVTNKKFIWDEGEIANKTIKQVINNNLDASKHAIIAAENQSVSLDRKGLGLTNMINPNRQLRLINDVIAFTKDNWNSSSLAITPEGVVAQTIVGNLILGNKLKIQNENNSFVIDKNGIDIQANMFRVRGGIPDEMIESAKDWNKISKNLSNLITDKTDGLKKELKTLDTSMKDFFSDGYITGSEANVLENTLEQLKEEGIKLNTFAKDLNITKESDDYNSAFNKLSSELFFYIKQPSYPIEINGVQRKIIQDCMTDLQAKKVILMNKINEILAKNAEKNAKEYAKKQVAQVDSLVKDVSENIYKFSDDGYLTLSEANILKNQLNQLTVEAEDLIKLGSSLNIGNEINAYQQSLKDLKEILSIYINKSDYPIEITELDRQRIDIELKNVNKYKTILSNKINQTLSDNAYEKSKSYTNTQFLVLNNEISLRAKKVDVDKLSDRIKNAEIKLQPDSITSTVMDSYRYKNENKQMQQRLMIAEQKIDSSGISNIVKHTEYIKELQNKMVTTETSLSLMKESISMKVNRDNVISSINMSPEKIKLNAEKIDLKGMVTISDLKGEGTVSINGSNIEGGTLKLGGIGNGSGKMIVNDERGNEVMSIDKSGLSLTMRYYNNSDFVQTLRIQDIYNNQLLTINSEGIFEFKGHIIVGDPRTGIITISPTEIGFPNVTVKASEYKGTLDIGGVRVGVDGIQRISAINYRGKVNRVTVYDGNAGLGALRCGSLSVSGSKQRIVKTKNYGVRAMNAFETCEPYFGDIQRNFIKNGTCKIKIEDIFKQTVKTNKQYEVLTWSYGNGQVWVNTNEMYKDYFIVHGTSDIEFGYIIIAKQAGVKDIRMKEETDIDENIIQEE